MDIGFKFSWKSVTGLSGQGFLFVEEGFVVSGGWGKLGSFFRFYVLSGVGGDLGSFFRSWRGHADGKDQPLGTVGLFAPPGPARPEGPALRRRGFWEARVPLRSAGG